MAKQRLYQNNNKGPFVISEGKFSFGQLKDSYYHTTWTEHSFFSSRGKSKPVLGLTFNLSVLRLVVAAGILLLGLLLARAAWLQIIKNDYYYLLAEGNRLRIESLEPRRGIIYDREMKPLVRNQANFVLYLKPIDLPRNELDRDEVIRRVAKILDQGSQESANNIGGPGNNLTLISDSPSFYQIKESLSEIRLGSMKSYQPLFIADNIEYDKAISLALEIDSLPGVFLSSKIRRQYLGVGEIDLSQSGPRSLSHVLGYTGKINQQELESLGADYSLIDYTGKSGLEYSWEKELKGKPGQKNIEVDALGKEKKVINETAAQDGVNLLLSVDLDLQKKIENVLDAYLKKAGLKKASVIALDPNNGEVLALVSWPAYDNNIFSRGINQEEYQKFLNDPDRPLYNRAISGEFPSGSTIKLVIAAAALQEKVIDENTSFVSNGGLRIGQWFFPDWKAGGHGLTNVRKALAESVNTFFYYIGGGYNDFSGLGLERLVKYSRWFGLGSKTGIDLPGEASGFVPTAAWKKELKDEPWYIGDTYHFAIGQGDVLVTPLQVANFTAAVANNGTLYKPHLVKGVLNEDNSLQREIKPEILRRDFISSENLKIVREGLRQTVTSGSARSLGILPVSAAGKTGTAQWSSTGAPHAWFTGFAPYEKPEIVITVLVEEGLEGSTIAVPIAREVLDWYFYNKKIKAGAAPN
ncbi:MAG: penicillin-binding protein 2 [Patescibacteria group bacterium]